MGGLSRLMKLIDEYAVQHGCPYKIHQLIKAANLTDNAQIINWVNKLA
jgi:hypothetical protein